MDTTWQCYYLLFSLDCYAIFFAFSFHLPLRRTSSSFSPSSHQLENMVTKKIKLNSKLCAHEYCLEKVSSLDFCVCGTAYPVCEFAYTLEMNIIILHFFLLKQQKKKKKFTPSTHSWIYKIMQTLFLFCFLFVSFWPYLMLKTDSFFHWNGIPFCFFFVGFQVLNNIDRTVISKVQPMEPKICYTNIKIKWIHRVRLSVDHHCKCVRRHHFHWNRQIDDTSQQLHQIRKIDIAPVVSL